MVLGQPGPLRFRAGQRRELSVDVRQTECDDAAATGITVYGNGVLTGGEARVMAAALLNAADVLDAIRGSHEQPGRGRVLLSAWDREMAAAGRSQRTRQEQVGIVGRVARATGEPVDAFTRDGLVTFLATPVRPLHPGHLLGRAQGVVGVVDDGRAPPERSDGEHDPVKSVKGLPARSPRRNWNGCYFTRMWPTTRAQILLAAYCGLRVHEIAKVRGKTSAVTRWWCGARAIRVDVLPCIQDC